MEEVSTSPTVRERGLTLALPTLVCGALCALEIGESQFRGDEFCTWWAARLPPDAFARLVGHVDAVLEPYYLFMGWWIGLFGDTEAAMRAPSAIAMAACAGLVALLGMRLANPAVGLRAGLVFGMLPLISRYGQEARPYAFATLFATLSTLLCLRLVSKPSSVGRALAYAVALAALGLSHMVALLILPAHAACCVRVTREKPYVRPAWGPLRSVGLSAFVGVCSVASIIHVGATQLPKQIGRYSESFDRFTQRMADIVSLGDLAAGALVLFLTVRSVRAAPRFAMVGLWALFPRVALFATYSLLHLFAQRYMVFTLPAVALLVAHALELPSLSDRLRRWVTPALVFALVVYGGGAQLMLRKSLARAQGDYRAMGAELRILAKPGDAVAYGGTKVIPRIPRLALSYQLREGPKLDDVFVTRSMAEGGSFLPEECLGGSSCLPSRVERLWLLTSESPGKAMWRGMPPKRAKFLKKEFQVASVHPHFRANLVLLTRVQRGPEVPAVPSR